MKTTKKTVENFGEVVADTTKKNHKARQSAKEQTAAAALRETATNEELINAAAVDESTKVDPAANLGEFAAAAAAFDNGEESPAADPENNQEKNESENSILRKICAAKFDYLKVDVLHTVAVDSLKKSIVEFYGEKYGEEFAADLFAAAAAETKNFIRTICDTKDESITIGFHEISINGERKAFAVGTGKPQTAAAICTVFNSYLNFAIREKLSCVGAIIRERESEKTAANIGKMTDKIGIDNLAEIIANNAALAAALLAKLQK